MPAAVCTRHVQFFTREPRLHTYRRLFELRRAAYYNPPTHYKVLANGSTRWPVALPAPDKRLSGSLDRPANHKKSLVTSFINLTSLLPRWDSALYDGGTSSWDPKSSWRSTCIPSTWTTTCRGLSIVYLGDGYVRLQDWTFVRGLASVKESSRPEGLDFTLYFIIMIQQETNWKTEEKDPKEKIRKNFTVYSLVLGYRKAPFSFASSPFV